MKRVFQSRKKTNQKGFLHRGSTKPLVPPRTQCSPCTSQHLPEGPGPKIPKKKIPNPVTSLCFPRAKTATSPLPSHVKALSHRDVQRLLIGSELPCLGPELGDPTPVLINFHLFTYFEGGFMGFVWGEELVPVSTPCCGV